MHDLIYSPYLVPVAGCAVAIAAIGFGTWKRVRERELDHELRLRELDLEKARILAGKAPKA